MPYPRNMPHSDSYTSCRVRLMRQLDLGVSPEPGFSRLSQRPGAWLGGRIPIRDIPYTERPVVTAAGKQPRLCPWSNLQLGGDRDPKDGAFVAGEDKEKLPPC